jgi:hypothetical protein
MGLCKDVRGPPKYVCWAAVGSQLFVVVVCRGVDVNPDGLSIALELGLSEAAVRGYRGCG